MDELYKKLKALHLDRSGHIRSWYFTDQEFAILRALAGMFIQTIPKNQFFGQTISVGTETLFVVNSPNGLESASCSEYYIGVRFIEVVLKKENIQC